MWWVGRGDGDRGGWRGWVERLVGVIGGGWG